LSRHGTAVTVSRVSGSEGLKKRLESLGFTIGSPVTVVSCMAGSLIVKVKDSRIALDRELAGHIFVSA
jgi:ferrous iron transport protein A